MPDPDSSPYTTHAEADQRSTRRVTVWHTNMIITDVPNDVPEADATEYVLRLADEGHVHFVAIEGDTWPSGSYDDESAYQPNPTLT